MCIKVPFCISQCVLCWVLLFFNSKDIVGFTSWSSQRDPEQVFTLLQAIFKSFDKAARKRGVFKVETIGDSYVAGKPQFFFVCLHSIALPKKLFLNLLFLNGTFGRQQ